MPRKVSIRSGWRCVDDRAHLWRKDDRFRRNGKRCEKCQCTEAAPAIWLLTWTDPELGCLQKHCHSFAEAIECANDQWHRINTPGYDADAPPQLLMKFGHARYVG
jgi:hypothetical protein